MNIKFHTDKKRKFNYNKINIDDISWINKKVNLVSNKNNRNDKELNKIINNNPNNSVKICILDSRNNKDSNNIKYINASKSIKKIKINDYYCLETKIGNRLPYIASPLKRKEYKDFSLMNFDSYNIVPIVLPNIENIRKTKTKELKY